MKTLLLSLAFTLLGWMATAKVYEDCDGVTRYVSSEYRQIYNASWVRPNGIESLYPKIGVSYSTNGEHKKWRMNMKISSLLPIRIYKGSRLLILLSTNEIIELVNSSADEDKIGSLESSGSLATANRSYRIVASYDVEEELIRKIIESGVSKVRIELPTTLHDESYHSNDKFTESLAKGFEEVLEYLRLNPGDERGMRDVYAGFVGSATNGEIIKDGAYNFMKAKSSGAFLVRDRRGEKTYYDADTKTYLTREEFLKKYEEWELEKLESLDQ